MVIARFEPDHVSLTQIEVKYLFQLSLSIVRVYFRMTLGDQITIRYDLLSFLFFLVHWNACCFIKLD